MAVITASTPDRVRTLERSAFAGVLTREATLFKRFWRSSAFGSVVEPTINLLAFGFGFGALVSTVAGLPYIQFIGTGMVALSVLFSSVFSGMYDTYVKRLYQRTYDGILATPVDVHELFLAEASWIAVRSGVFGCAPLIIAMAFGLPPSWGMLAVPFIGALTGFGFALMGMWFSALVPSIDSFTYVQSALVTPLLLISGIYFPITGFPQWVQTLAEINPLYHCVNLVRDAVFGWQWSAVGDVAVLAVFGALMAVLAVRSLRTKLID
ncbi:MAG TPA: ABC transporter permease [Candidatus Nanopelagicales bacterium]|nr:ABC transporter permease [Candidatus Nanopelagicales bacterium]